MKVSLSFAILGAGPSALAAAHGIKMAAYGGNRTNVTFYSKADAGAAVRKSELFGAQYLHAALPGVDCGTPRKLAVQFYGTAEGYRDKVYGPNYRGPVSPSEFHDDHNAWDIRYTYDRLWDMYMPELFGIGIDFERGMFDEVYEDLRQTYDGIICTLPRRVLCINPEHEFKSQNVYAVGDAPARGIKCPVSCEVDTLVYNGSPDYGWYRKSNIFGHTTAEWSANADRAKPPLSNLALVEKPISTNCDCWPGIKFLGRYGEWKKGVLVHQVYNEAYSYAEVLQEKGSQGALF